VGLAFVGYGEARRSLGGGGPPPRPVRRSLGVRAWSAATAPFSAILCSF